MRRERSLQCVRASCPSRANLGSHAKVHQSLQPLEAVCHCRYEKVLGEKERLQQDLSEVHRQADTVARENGQLRRSAESLQARMHSGTARLRRMNSGTLG